MGGNSPGWNYGDIFDLAARAIPFDRPAVIFEDRALSWRDYDRRTNNLARALLDRGFAAGDRVAFYHRNGPEYLELLAACFKARLSHVNINYRYKDEEILHILENSGAVIVSFDDEFAPLVERIRKRAPRVRLWLQQGAVASAFAEPFEALAGRGDGEPVRNERSPDDELMLYTGGTTGMPKGVVWKHGVLRAGQLAALSAILPTPKDMEEHQRFVAEEMAVKPALPACPLMHGTGLTSAMGQLCLGQPVVMIDSKAGFDPARFWRAVEAHSVFQITIVGDAFARPLAQALETMTPPPDLSRLALLGSAGAMFSKEMKTRMLELIPHLVIVDVFAASESMGYGAAISTRGNVAETAKIQLAPNVAVFTEDGRRAEPGEKGLIAVKGWIGVGYHNDPDKTTATYKTIDGERWCVPGDWALMGEGGAATLLGRGSNCINTAGEKVFPEEVEEVLKRAPGVEDALVLGVPDERWGSAVVAVVSAHESASGHDEESLKRFVRDRIADYKTPKRIVFTREGLRQANGKADYAAAKRIVAAGSNA